MSDIRHALLRRDPLSAAKEVLYHLDIALGSSLQNPGGLDKNTVELVEEFIFHIPKERNTQRKVRGGGEERGNPDVNQAILLTLCVCVCVSEDELCSGAAAVGDHEQLFPGAE